MLIYIILLKFYNNIKKDIDLWIDLGDYILADMFDPEHEEIYAAI